jgi:hypothetical protein
MLTQSQMNKGHLARQVALDPLGQIATGDAEYDARRTEYIAEGKQILKEYTLTYSERFTVLPPETPADAAGVLKVDSGHLATSPAYRLAIFRKRKE